MRRPYSFHFKIEFKFWTLFILYILIRGCWYARMEYGVTVKLTTRAYLNGGLNIWTFKPWLRTLIKLFGTFLPLHSGTFWYHVSVEISSLIWVEVVLFAVYLVFGYIKMRYFEWLQEFCVLPGFKYLHACGQYYFSESFSLRSI